MPLLDFVPFDAFWITVAALLVASAGALERLRTRHRLVWEALGRPRLAPTRLGAARALTRFYWSGRVPLLGDPALERWVLALRFFQCCLVAVLWILARHLGTILAG